MSEYLEHQEEQGRVAEQERPGGAAAGGSLERRRSEASRSGREPPAADAVNGIGGGGGRDEFTDDDMIGESYMEDAQAMEPPEELSEELPEEFGPPEELPEEEFPEEPIRMPRLGTGVNTRKPRTPRIVKPEQQQGGRGESKLTPEQRLLMLDTWQRSGLPAGDFADMVGISKFTLGNWKKRFDEQGPGGLVDQPRQRTCGKLPDLTRRTILMLKQANPDYGCQRISDMLFRGPGLPASPTTVAKVLHDAGYVTEERATKPHPDRVRRFERASPNQLWQTDLFTFLLKRQNRRVYLVAFMDDHSRYIVSYGLHASASSALVLEVFRAGITACGAPEEVLTDNGPQYVTWRGTSAFAKELAKQGIRHVVASPRRPQTLGKIERFWGSLWRECLGNAIFIDMADARTRIGHFIDHYNFQRTHQGIEGLVPADRFFQAAPEVLKTLRKRVAANAMDLARHGVPKEPFYLTGQVGGNAFSVHAEGERVIMTRQGQVRQEIDLTSPSPTAPESVDVAAAAAAAAAAPPPSTTPAMPPPVCSQGIVTSALPTDDPPMPPGTSSLDEGLARIAESFQHPIVEVQPWNGGAV